MRKISSKVAIFLKKSIVFGFLLMAWCSMAAMPVLAQSSADYEWKCVETIGCAFYDPYANACGDQSNTGAPAQVSVDAIKESYVKIIIGVGKALNLGQNAARIALMIALTETNLKNYANVKIPLSQQNAMWKALPEPRPIGSDGFSVGIMQQQVTTNWNTAGPQGAEAIGSKEAVDQLMNPAYAAQAVYGSPPGSNMHPALMKGIQNKPNWESQNEGVIAQAVQISAHPERYIQRQTEANALLAKYWDSSPAVQLVVPLNSGSGGANNTTSPQGECTTGAVNCDNNNSVTGAQPSGAPQQGIRATIVCIALAELALWDSGQMKPGTDFHKYSEGKTEEWCADFVSWVYNKAGFPLQQGAWRVPAVATIYNLGQKAPLEYHPSNSGYTPRPGDLLIHSEPGNAFNHVNMVVSVEGSKVNTVGGNQGPGGSPTARRVTSGSMSSFTAEYTIGYVGPATN